jgi:hypothetical protein
VKAPAAVIESPPDKQLHLACVGHQLLNPAQEKQAQQHPAAVIS